MTKLYELKRRSFFKINEEADTPISSKKSDISKTYKLHSIDGMYSYCTDEDGEIYHLAAWSEVTEVNNDSLQTTQTT